MSGYAPRTIHGGRAPVRRLRLAHNGLVGGSNPTGPTTQSRYYGDFLETRELPPTGGVTYERRVSTYDPPFPFASQDGVWEQIHIVGPGPPHPAIEETPTLRIKGHPDDWPEAGKPEREPGDGGTDASRRSESVSCFESTLASERSECFQKFRRRCDLGELVREQPDDDRASPLLCAET